MPDTTTPAAREVRWITPTGHTKPVPAWQDDDGFWLLASAPRLVPAGTRTHQLIEAAAPALSVPVAPADAAVATADSDEATQ